MAQEHSLTSPVGIERGLPCSLILLLSCPQRPWCLFPSGVQVTSLCVLGYCHLLSCLAVRCLVYVGLKEVAKESEAEEAGGAEKCASWLDRTTAWKLCVFTCYLFEHLLSSPGEGVGWGIDRRCLFSFFALSLSLCLDFSQHSPKRLSSKENLVFFLLLSQPHSLSLYRSLG